MFILLYCFGSQETRTGKEWECFYILFTALETMSNPYTETGDNSLFHHLNTLHPFVTHDCQIFPILFKGIK